jgi:ABC-type Fe3+ transport system substrate-binding protein
VAFVVVLLLSAACAPGKATPAAPAPGPPAASAEAPAGAPAGWNQVVAAARQEGEVIVWGAAGADARRHEKEAFESAYPGIKVTLFQPPSNSERDSRFLQELQAGVAKVDVLVSGSGGANARLKPAGALQDVRPFLVFPEVTEPARWRDGSLTWVDKDEQRYLLQGDIQVTPNLIAHESVDPAEVQSWEELLQPKWRGQVLMQDPRKSGNGFALGLFLYYAPELGPEFTRRLYGEMDVTFAQDERQNIEWVASGRKLIYLRPDDGELAQALEAGAKLKVVPVLKAQGKPVDSSGGSQGILFLPNLDPLPHPNATKLYVNWFYSRAGQQAMVDIVGRASRRTDVDHSKLAEFARPRPDIAYMNLNHYTEPDVTQAMRDDVSRWYGK